MVCSGKHKRWGRERKSDCNDYDTKRLFIWKNGFKKNILKKLNIPKSGFTVKYS